MFFYHYYLIIIIIIVVLCVYVCAYCEAASFWKRRQVERDRTFHWQRNHVILPFRHTIHDGPPTFLFENKIISSVKKKRPQNLVKESKHNFK